MTTTRNRVAVLHGVNFDILERRDADLYGGSRWPSRTADRRAGGAAGLEPLFFQTNHEGEFVQYLPPARRRRQRDRQRRRRQPLQPGDRRRPRRRRAAGDRVHLSDVERREDWRKLSVFDGLVSQKISGQGPDAYREALDALAAELW